MTNLNLVPVIELSGSHYDMGLEFGKTFKAQIQEFAKTRMDRLKSFVKRYGKIDVSDNQVLAIAEDLLQEHKLYNKALWEEFQGIALGAELPLNWLLVANAYTDLRDYICKVLGFNDAEVRFEGCSAFILDKTMSADNTIVIGQTWDMSVEAVDYLVIVKKRPNDGSAHLLYLTTMGGLALLGLSENKLAIGTTNLMANDCTKGVNYLLTITAALMANDYSAMLESIKTTNRLSGHSFLCASADQGDLIETSSSHYLDYPLDHYPLVITNNYSEMMRKFELIVPSQRRRNSLYRYGRTLSLLVEKEKWQLKDLWSVVLGDCTRSGSGAAICNQDYASKYSEFATLATAILVPAAGQMWVCRGGAENGVLQVVNL